MEETKRIIREYGNHPSLAMLAHGNEAAGGEGLSTHATAMWLKDYVHYFKAYDPRRLYTSSAGYPLTPENQYHCIYRPRIHFWNHNLRSRINALPPETITDYRKWVERFPVPLVSHEVGQWCAFPNLKEIPKYTGFARAGSFEIVRDSLLDKKMLDQANNFYMASGKLQVICYKEEVESCLRTEGLGGFQILSLNDDHGYGDCLWGILDAFYDPKDYINAAEFRRFCNNVVPLAKMQKRYWLSCETFTADVEIAQFGPATLTGQEVFWTLKAGNKFLGKGTFNLTLPRGKLCAVGQVKADLTPVTKATKAKLTISLPGTRYENDWDIWIYPPKLPEVSSEVVIVETLKEGGLDALREGEKVLLLPEYHSIKGDETLRRHEGKNISIHFTQKVKALN